MKTVLQSPVLAAVELDREAVQRGEYVHLGQLAQIRTAKGRMEWFHDGPHIGALTTRSSLHLVLLEGLPALPARRSILDQPCPKCSAVCGQCEGEKQTQCLDCGGAGSRPRWKPCICAQNTVTAVLPSAVPAAGCLKCGGAGRVDVRQACRLCQGSGQMKCPVCKGYGADGTGRIGAKICPECHGQGRKIKLEPQDIHEFLMGEKDGFLALGPIVSLLYNTDDAAGKLVIIEISPDRDGNVMAMLTRFQRGGRPAEAYFYGGVAKLATD